MFALVNAIHKTETSFGCAISRHRSILGAVAERRAIDRKFKRENSGAYIQTVIVEGRHLDLVGHVLHSDAREVDPASVQDAELQLADRRPFRHVTKW
jgi:hypothetical protein